MSFRVKETQETFYGLVARLRQDLPFVYTRYGDGEMEIVLGGGGGGQDPNPHLAKETADLFFRSIDNRNLIGLARHANEPGMEPGLFQSWSDPRYNVFDQLREFENAVPLHYLALSKPFLLRQFFDLTRRRKKAVVTAQTGDLTPLVGPHDLIVVPEFNAYNSMDQWYRQLSDYDLIFMACGPAKCAANLQLLRENRFVQSIDLGSVADYALNQVSRTWIRLANERFPDARKVLLGE